MVVNETVLTRHCISHASRIQGPWFDSQFGSDMVSARTIEIGSWF
jgi:hypothetical protein